MTDAAPLVSILIASIGRIGLARTVVSTRHAAQALGEPFEIVIADDSDDGKVGMLLQSTAICLDGIRIVATASGNIAHARNACLAHATGRYLAFIDDDEWVDDTWLSKHLAVLDEFGADASFGAVEAHYEAAAPAWVKQANPFTRGPRVRGERLTRGSTANALVQRAALQDRNLFFDQGLGKTGGEDVDLFSRFHRQGGILVGSDAVLYEDVPLARCVLKYLIPRAVRHGQTFAINEICVRKLSRRCSFFLGALLKLFGSLLTGIALLPFGLGRALPSLLSATRNFGKLRQLFGLPLVTYYHSNGPQTV